MYVTPPSKTAASRCHPTRSPAMRPGVKFNTKSATPAGSPARRLSFNSSPLYSSPNINRSNSTPISAPMRSKFSLSLRGARPPWPKARPAKRYRGIAEKPQRLASRASTARPTMTRPSSMKTNDTSCAVETITEYKYHVSYFATLIVGRWASGDDGEELQHFLPQGDCRHRAVTRHRER